MNMLKFFSSVGICLLVAFVGSAITVPSIGVWYAGLEKPFFTPPSFVFGPVWTLLYLVMGIALYMVWMKGLQKKGVKSAIRVFFIQLLLNFLWSLVFFGLHLPLMAFIVILALWLAIFWTIRSFYKISKHAAYLLIPYLAWVTFASFLNLGIVLLNW